MRLLRLENDGGFSLEDFTNREIPEYAILSHTWGPDTEEVTFKDLTEGTGENKEGYRKLFFCAMQAAQDGLQFFWADTCCIDKSSSSELSEAINSMFRYYQDAQKCYVYLSDVSLDTSDRSPEDSFGWRREFEKSRWFTRGWTLQELLAPKHVIFYNRHWKPLGTKSEHALWISKIAAIDAETLTGGKYSITATLKSLSVAKRMSWASQRETTRTEDMAYCLLGIFDVNIPLLYGERERAFIRLQEEILRTTCDDSILAWGLDAETHYPKVPVNEASSSYSPILAPSPKNFKACGNLVCATEPSSSFRMTNLGLEIQIPMVFMDPLGDPERDGFWIGLLNCSPETGTDLLAITLFFPATRNHNSSQFVKRAPVWRGRLLFHTLIVGPRVAVQSVLQKVIIAQGGRDQFLPWSLHFLGCRQIIVNQSQDFRRTGYAITDGTGLNLAEDREWFKYRPSWDPAAQVLTIEDKRISKDLLQFCFVSQWTGPHIAFTLFLRTATKRALVQRGFSFPEETVRRIYDLLDGIRQDSLDESTMIDSKNEPFRVVIEINEVAVYGWRMFEVNVDAQQVILGLSMEEITAFKRMGIQ